MYMKKIYVKNPLLTHSSGLRYPDDSTSAGVRSQLGAHGRVGIHRNSLSVNVRGVFNKFPDFFVQASKIVVDS